jgi:hypothetical protein
MLDSSQFDPRTSYLINLFDNEEPSENGNSLIRIRVLEYFRKFKNALFTEIRFIEYFERLGYKLDRVHSVIELFVGAGLLSTKYGLSPDQIRSFGIDKAGTITIEQQNVTQYFEELLNSPWYFICAKRGIYVDEKYISKDAHSNEYIADKDFIEFLKEEEDRERKRIQIWEAKYGSTSGTVLLQPHILAKNALRKRRRHK